MNRRPITPYETEVLYRVRMVCDPENVSASRDLLFQELEPHNCPICEIEALCETEEMVELAPC